MTKLSQKVNQLLKIRVMPLFFIFCVGILYCIHHFIDYEHEITNILGFVFLVVKEINDNERKTRESSPKVSTTTSL